MPLANSSHFGHDSQEEAAGWLAAASGYHVRLGENGRVQCRNGKGKLLSTVPASIKDDPQVVQLRQLAERAPEPDQWVFPPTGGDRFLLCTDGLTTELEDSRIAEVLRRDLDAQSTADELVKLAVEAGGHDNVTVVVLDHLVATDEISDDTTPRSVT